MSKHLENLTDKTLWRSLFYFNIYRISLGAILVLISLTTEVIQPPRYPLLFQITSISIMAIAIFYFFAINSGRISVSLFSHFQTSFDLVAIALLMYSSNGFQSGFGILMMISVASYSLLGSKFTAIAYAALGSLLAILEQFTSFFYHSASADAFAGGGFLGLGLFTTAVTVSTLAEQVKRSETLASKQSLALASLDAINNQIVERVPTGVIALDKNDRIVVSNNRARSLLKINDLSNLKLSRDLPELRNWLSQHRTDHPKMAVEFHYKGSTMQPSQIRLFNGSLVFLEDISGEREQSRQLRLAALGRLAAAVAHEVRNPLSAIYQSAQLAQESTDLSNEDRALVDIIAKQSRRLDRTIEAVLNITRGDSGTAETIELKPWLSQFTRSFIKQNDLPETSIEISGNDASITMDSSHLEQIITNLCENAFAHRDPQQDRFMRFEIRVATEFSRPVLDVIDFGVGIPESHRVNLFEPFFTTRTSGTGLGLYITRELCEANQAKINFPPDRSETVFQIMFLPAMP